MELRFGTATKPVCGAVAGLAHPTATGSGLDAIASPGQDVTAVLDSRPVTAPHPGFVAVPNRSSIAVPVFQTQPLSLPRFPCCYSAALNLGPDPAIVP
ncbi:hypothetical protein ElyMa_000858400 [Elysia marginata]|uniref:Uncharacterized protein n=1 Tax=Elysia marginata TaxID=1093978 RepID=A0AAV4H2U0_9GAST|nr:hypothetical protein ElyMa_000858400 [Elysia marginata]